MKCIPVVINLLASLFRKIYAKLLPLYGRQNSRCVSTRPKVWFVFWIVSFQERFSPACLTLRARAWRHELAAICHLFVWRFL